MAAKARNISPNVLPATSTMKPRVDPSQGDLEPTSSDEEEEVVTKGALHNQFNVMNTGFRSGFMQQRKQIDAQFEEQRKQFEEQRLYMAARFDDIVAQTRNQLAIGLRSKTYPVSGVDPITQARQQPPEELFPRWVGVFWRLKKRRNWPRLARLHKFYGTNDWDQWGLDLPYYDSEDINADDGDVINIPRHRTIEEAVEHAADFALSELARIIGLDYKAISDHIAENITAEQLRAEIQKNTKQAARAPGPSPSHTKWPKTLSQRRPPISDDHPQSG